MAEPTGGALPHDWLNSLSVERAAESLLRCCASRRWVAGMLARRPFDSARQLQDTARTVWSALERTDYLEAFAGHPPIGGDLAQLRAKFAPTSVWSSQEQVEMTRADDATLLALRAENQAYIERFGFLFIICATGKTAPEMLRALRERLGNDDASELRQAAAEQEKITALRLDKLGA